MIALARWCFRHRGTVIGAWVALLLLLGGASAAAGTSYTNGFSLPGTDSTRALDLLQESLPAASGDSDQIVVHVPSGSVRNAAVRARIDPALAAVAKLPSVEAVTSPYGPQGAARVSPDGRTAYATVAFDAQAADLPVDHVQAVIDTARAARGNGVQVELGGPAITQVTAGAPANSEGVGIVAAAVILFLAFGSLLGMLVPLLVAVAGVGGGILTIGLLSHLIGLATAAPTLAALVGLGVGIDYALFIVTRYRTGLQAGLDPETAAARALDTSGRAVLFAGGTVVVALMGLLVLRVSFLTGLGIGAAVTVLITVAAAVTLMPALLGVFGIRLITRAQRRTLAGGGPRHARAAGLWARWASVVARHRIVLSAAVIAVIAVLSIPTLSIRLGTSDAGNDPAGTTTRKAYDLLAQGFGPGSNGPLLLVSDLRSPGDARAFAELLTAVGETQGVAAVAAAPLPPGATADIATVVPTTSPQSRATDQLIDRLRGRVLPAAERGTTLDVHVGGSTAVFKDFAGVLTGKLPLFLAVIVALGCLLLVLAFRSVVVPLTAAVMNVLAAAASFGVVVAVFQFGWGAGLLGVGRNGPVDAFVPVILLAILFGLSTDYQVFLVSRMHEEWELTHDNSRAVAVGQAETGRVITAAALIMVFVFGAFVLGGQRTIAEFGVGLASAVAIDAFLLRTVLVPALMHLLGRANWWLPAWLDQRLPHLSVEGAPGPVVAAPGAAADDHPLRDEERHGTDATGPVRPVRAS